MSRGNLIGDGIRRLPDLGGRHDGILGERAGGRWVCARWVLRLACIAAGLFEGYSWLEFPNSRTDAWFWYGISSFAFNNALSALSALAAWRKNRFAFHQV
jgi:hypothetical protein